MLRHLHALYLDSHLTDISGRKVTLKTQICYIVCVSLCIKVKNCFCFYLWFTGLELLVCLKNKAA